MKIVKVLLGGRSYEILIGRNMLDACGAKLKKLGFGSDALIVTNAHLESLYGGRLRRSLIRSGFTVRFETVPDSEKAKSIGAVTTLLNKLAAYDVGRKISLIAFGGGVIGDLTGFVASVYKRGIPYVQIPTTLLAQVDSAVGGKTAVDLPVAKNLVGTFCQPMAVLSDVSLIKSLPPRQIRSGLAEIIKYGIIKDSHLFRFLEKNMEKLLDADWRALQYVVLRCCRIKSKLVESDELDKKGKRIVLNYGHTIGHAIESATHYSGRYNHGEAVSIGMLVAADVASDLGLIREIDVRRIESLIKRSGLPLAVKNVKLADIYRSHLHDKKFVGTANRFILPSRIGAVKTVDNVPDSAIRNALKGRSAS